MEVTEVIHQGVILARYIPGNAWKEGLCFFSKDEEFIQVGSWNYDQGKILAAHMHNHAERCITHTQEVLYIRKGAIKATVYDLEGNPIKDLFAQEGDVLILLNGGHGYSILENNTQVLEIKNGPYLGAEVDRQRI